MTTASPDRASWRADLLIAGAVFAVYGVGLLQVPHEPDDLVLYSSVARASNPFSYFAGDIGLSNHVYRPLHAAIAWVSYRLFGVWALPEQLLSIILHAIVGILLFDILRRLFPMRPRWLLLLLTLVALVSPYTTSGVTWIADRPMLGVALALLLTVRHLIPGGAAPQLPILLGLSLLAMLSQESGVMVPIVVALYGWVQSRRAFVIGGVGLVVGYLAFRVAIFGADALVYSESGVLFGVWHYDDSLEFHGIMRAAMLAGNVATHIVALALPVFDYQGELLLHRPLWVQAPLWLSTAGLVIVTAARPSRAQWCALGVILLNALVHAAVFRHRTLYIAQLAWVGYLAGSSALDSPVRRRLTVVLAALLLAFSTFRVEQWLVRDVEIGREQLNGLETGDDRPEVDPMIIQQIKQVYAR